MVLQEIRECIEPSWAVVVVVAIDAALMANAEDVHDEANAPTTLSTHPHGILDSSNFWLLF